jgi:hypothetical protein
MRTLGTSQADVSYGISADGLGSIYITGVTGSSLGGPSLGNSDAFVSKYDAAGNLHWTTQLGSAFNDVSYGVSADRLGNVFAVGSVPYRDPATGALQTAIITGMDADGNLRWTSHLDIPTFGLVEAHGVSADGLGNVYVTGRMWSFSGELTTKRYDIFLGKFDSSGHLQWTRQQGGDFNDESFGVTADRLGNVYISGAIDYGVTFAKYDDSGAMQWTKQDIDVGTSVSADQFGNVYVVGGNSPQSNINVTPLKRFISKYDSTGSLLWTHELEPFASDVVSLFSRHESGLEVTADGLGNAYVTGHVFVRRPGQSGYYEAFVSKYDALGNHMDTTMLGNGSSDNVGLGIVLDGLGNVYITGETRAILGSGSSARGDANAFIAKFRDEAVPEPAGIAMAAVGLLFVAMRRCRFLASGIAIPSASRRDAATCGRVSPRLARNVMG